MSSNKVTVQFEVDKDTFDSEEIVVIGKGMTPIRVKTVKLEPYEDLEKKAHELKADFKMEEVENLIVRMKASYSSSIKEGVLEFIDKFLYLSDVMKKEIIQKSINSLTITHKQPTKKECFINQETPLYKELLEAWVDLPSSVRKFLNLVQESKSEPIFHEDAEMCLPIGGVYIPLANSNGHSYPLFYPVLITGDKNVGVSYLLMSETRNHLPGMYSECYSELKPANFLEIVAVHTSKLTNLYVIF